MAGGNAFIAADEEGIAHVYLRLRAAQERVQRYTLIWLSSYFECANTFAYFIGYEFFILHGVPEWNAERERCATARGGSLLQSLPSAKTVHRTVLAFTSCRAHVVSVGLCPTPRKPFEKGLTENF